MISLKIEILCTGDEILSGKTVNTNYSFVARRLQESGFNVRWGTVVGDHEQCLVEAFHQAAGRSDFVIVNGGLGPTVDDLSQQVAARAAGVELELHESWLEHIAGWYESRGRTMPENNTKQAMLPAGAELIDNPIGTACGFALDIGGARFFFTPGVPRELKLMLEDQILPRLVAIRGNDIVSRVKRFHTFGIGESRVDRMLDGVEAMAADGAVKLGFQSHFPQLETKLTIQGANISEIEEKLAPLESAVRERLGNFVLAEDDETLEGSILASISEMQGSLSVWESITGGNIIARLMGQTDSMSIVKRGQVSQGFAISDFDDADTRVGSTMHCRENAVSAASDFKDQSRTTHAIVAWGFYDDGDGNRERGADVFTAVAGPGSTICRESRLPGSRSWVRLAATELALDTLRRYLHDLPVGEKIDFEQQ